MAVGNRAGEKNPFCVWFGAVFLPFHHGLTLDPIVRHTAWAAVYSVNENDVLYPFVSSDVMRRVMGGGISTQWSRRTWMFAYEELYLLDSCLKMATGRESCITSCLKVTAG